MHVPLLSGKPGLRSCRRPGGAAAGPASFGQGWRGVPALESAPQKAMLCGSRKPPTEPAMLDVAKPAAALPAIPFDCERLDRLMEAAGLDVLLVNSKHNLQYL
jgi:hypothetical protein